MALSSNSRIRPASKDTPPKTQSSPAPAPEQSVSAPAHSPSDEISKLLDAINEASGQQGIAEGGMKNEESSSSTVPEFQGPRIPDQKDSGVPPTPSPQPSTSNVERQTSNVIPPVKPKTVRLSRPSTSRLQPSSSGLQPQTAPVDFVLPPGPGSKSQTQITEIKTAAGVEINLAHSPDKPQGVPKRGTVRLTGSIPNLHSTGRQHTTLSGTTKQTTGNLEQSPVLKVDSQPTSTQDFKTGTDTTQKEEDWTPRAANPKEAQRNKITTLVSVLLLLLILLATGAYLFVFVIKNDGKTTTSRTQTVSRPAATKKATNEVPVEPVVDVPQEDNTSTSGEVVDIPQDDEQVGGTNLVETSDQIETTPEIEVEVDASPEVEIEVETIPETEAVPEPTAETAAVPEKKAASPVVPATNVTTSAISKFIPPWLRKKDPDKEDDAKTIDVPEAVDVPEAKEWPILKVTAVIGGGKKGSALVNGYVVSIGEELEEGPTLKSISKQAAVFEWDGETRTVFVSSKVE